MFLRIGLILIITGFVASCKDQPDRLSTRPPREELNVVQLFLKNDCFTCHKIDGKAIGPAYLRVADKYKDSPDQIEYLASKIIEGGGGIWGGAVMSRHPFLKMEQTTMMANWILGLVELDIREKSGSNIKYEIYTNAGGTEQLIDSFSLSNFNLPEQRKSGFIDRDVRLEIEGDVTTTVPALTLFHLSKDEGAELWLDDSLLIARDIEKRQVIYELDSGKHNLKIVYFHEKNKIPNVSLRWVSESVTKYGIVE